MIDIHIHILPGVDDGAGDYEDSFGMAKQAWSCGTRTICSTPHANQMGRYENFYTAEFSRRFDSLKEILRSYRIPIQILEGMEIMASDDMIHKIREGKLISLNNTQYYLLEFPFEAHPDWIKDRLEDILSIGATPVIAHVERYHCVLHEPQRVYDWIQMGCATQMNKGSILGRFGRKIQKVCEPLLNYELIHCVASDAHGTEERTPWMRDAYEYIIRHFDEEYARELFEINPSHLLNGETIKNYGQMPSIRVYM